MLFVREALEMSKDQWNNESMEAQCRPDCGHDDAHLSLPPPTDLGRIKIDLVPPLPLSPLLPLSIPPRPAGALYQPVERQLASARHDTGIMVALISTIRERGRGGNGAALVLVLALLVLAVAAGLVRTATVFEVYFDTVAWNETTEYNRAIDTTSPANAFKVTMTEKGYLVITDVGDQFRVILNGGGQGTHVDPRPHLVRQPTTRFKVAFTQPEFSKACYPLLAGPSTLLLRRSRPRSSGSSKFSISSHSWGERARTLSIRRRRRRPRRRQRCHPIPPLGTRRPRFSEIKVGAT
ncbi:hypothetical protein AMAG_10623 [Allomyces macrogynus ATCC 38327]|uniref:Uncharacterized protein n=1 Tax=Allomyces macrogynus (strain ATCC 38327) TaxID=578462 RepID=A0A0L0SRI9_ALLM3|nr:hypothetical protein AMAG_10623 [Allomyces macrogynus ATCC 38327]|eukprot:KNE64959.1 hypothetical protein AMAG_10623 [Allomyces macrogynus ATCC 38327]